MKATQDWVQARVHALRDVTPTVREFTLAPSGGALPQEPGSHLQVQIDVGQSAFMAGGRLHTRSYSLIGAPGGGASEEFYRIAVKRLDAGRGGSRAMWQLAVGDSLYISSPQNHFPLDLTAPAYCLVAAGVGVTPLLGMAQLLAKRGAQVQMAYAARSDDELAYLAPLQQCLGGRLQTYVSEHGQRIDLHELSRQVPPDSQLYFCGPSSMLTDARLAWGSAGRDMSDFRYETFGSSGRFAPQAFRVMVPRHGLDIIVDQDTGLLDALELNGIQTLSDCRRGECGLCAMDVLQLTGEIDHRDVFLSDEEKTANHKICVCVSRVVGEITLETAYRPES